jgi:hypothetical protein
MKPDIRPLVHAERAALIVDLAALEPGQWDAASLCEGRLDELEGPGAAVPAKA